MRAWNLVLQEGWRQEHEYKSQMIADYVSIEGFEGESWVMMGFLLWPQLGGGPKVKWAPSHSYQARNPIWVKSQEKKTFSASCRASSFFWCLPTVSDSRAPRAFKSAQGDRNKCTQETCSFTDKHIYPSVENRLESFETKWTVNTHWPIASWDKNCEVSLASPRQNKYRIKSTRKHLRCFKRTR